MSHDGHVHPRGLVLWTLQSSGVTLDNGNGQRATDLTLCTLPLLRALCPCPRPLSLPSVLRACRAYGLPAPGRTFHTSVTSHCLCARHPFSWTRTSLWQNDNCKLLCFLPSLHTQQDLVRCVG